MCVKPIQASPQRESPLRESTFLTVFSAMVVFPMNENQTQEPSKDQQGKAQESAPKPWLLCVAEQSELDELKTRFEVAGMEFVGADNAKSIVKVFKAHQESSQTFDALYLDDSASAPDTLAALTMIAEHTRPRPLCFGPSAFAAKLNRLRDEEREARVMADEEDTKDAVDHQVTEVVHSIVPEMIDLQDHEVVPAT